MVWLVFMQSFHYLLIAYIFIDFNNIYCTYAMHRLLSKNHRFSTVKAKSNTVKYGYRPAEAADALGSAKLLEECVKAGWIKPDLRRHKLTLYDHAALAVCWARILNGEMPNGGDPTSRCSTT